MKRTIKLIADGAEQILEARTGELLPAVLKRYKVPLDLPCGGKGTCKGCPILIDGKMCEACQTKVLADMQVELHADGNVQNIAEGDIAQTPPVNPMFEAYGIAVDIGTTTICAALLDRAGRGDTVTRKNPQAAFGADVISRIEHALEGEAPALAASIRTALSEMISELCAKRGIDSGLVDALVVTGNTAMLYLLTGQNPKALSHAPFLADRLFGEFIGAGEWGLPISQNARVYLPRCISAFVGGDISCAVLASGMCAEGATTLLVDIGTNGEIALWNGTSLICCSTAAGPALEGAGITHGSYGVSGAIDRVWQEAGAVKCATIGGKPAIGICGSGIVDAVAVMLETEIIEETGAFAGDADVLPLKDGVDITAADVRKVQLAKGSVRAGIETLLETEGLAHADIGTLYIAGGFGSFLNLDSAAKIGLIPAGMSERTKVIGNAAHTGAVMLLADENLIASTVQLVEGARTVSLDANPVFTDNYMEYMMF